MYNGVTDKQSSSQEGVNLLNVHDTANRALFAIEFHSAECDKRQVRIENSITETRNSIERANATISAAQKNLYERIETQGKDLTEKFEQKTDKINDKVDALAIKMAGAMGGIIAIREVIAYAVKHFSP